MVTKKELQKIKSTLPINGYSLIAAKTGLSTNIISHAFNNPKRYKTGVVEAALEVIKEYKQQVSDLKNRIKKETV